MNVRLRMARLVPAPEPFAWLRAEFEIEVQNLGYEKKVAVHFSSGNELLAHYAGPLENGSELWTLRVPESDAEGTLGKSVSWQFCIRYGVNATSYWDNNSGWNYQLNPSSSRAP
jgi:hypothetical protein